MRREERERMKKQEGRNRGEDGPGVERNRGTDRERVRGSAGDEHEPATRPTSERQGGREE